MTQQALQGAAMLAWSVMVGVAPDLSSVQFYGSVLHMLAWTGHAQMAWCIWGSLSGLGMIYAGLFRHDLATRCLAINAMGFWLLVASAFLSAWIGAPACAIYLFAGLTNGHAAAGRPLR